MKPRRVVITGLGALTPIGNSLPAYWEGLLSGTSGAAPITHFDASRFKTQFACGNLKGGGFLDSRLFLERSEGRAKRGPELLVYFKTQLSRSSRWGMLRTC